MAAINNILFPTDFSDNARNALNYALEIALHSGATLHIVHSIEEPYDFAPMVEEIKKTLGHRVQKLFDEMQSEIRQNSKYKEVNIKTYMQTGRALYVILDETRSRNMDLVVMGTKGRSGMEKILLGSTTAEVIQHSKVPVLAVPRKASFSGLKQILFATDFQDGDLEALEYVAELAGLFDAKLKVFHSSVENDLRSEILFRGFRELAAETVSYPHIKFEQDKTISFFEAVADQIEKDKISMLVMIRYNKPFSLFAKKHSKEMSYYIQVPLLVLPGEETPIQHSEKTTAKTDLKASPQD